MKIKKINRKSKLIKKLLFAVVFIISLALIWDNSAKVFSVQAIECYTQYGTCPQEYSQDLTWIQNYPLLKPLPSKKVSEQLKKFFEIKQVTLYRRLPKTLVLSVQVKKPIGIIGPQVLGSHSVVDEEGVVISQTSKSNLPVLIDLKNYQPGERVTPNQIRSFGILSLLSQLSDERVFGEISSNQLNVKFGRDTEVLFDLAHLPSSWYPTLQVILSRSKISLKMPKVIDLRFGSPTITF